MNVKDFADFGQIILEARKSKDLSLKQCASLIYKEDGSPISFQYLSEIENARRNPPSEFIMKQLADVLEIPVEVLYYYSKILPSDIDARPSKDTIVVAYRDFLSKLQQEAV